MAMRGKHGTILAFVNLDERVSKRPSPPRCEGCRGPSLGVPLRGVDGMSSDVGRASVPPGRLLKASLIISLYSVRGEPAPAGNRTAQAPFDDVVLKAARRWLLSDERFLRRRD